MARVVEDAATTTRNARAKLGLGVHWRGIDPEVHLGYRKANRGGAWVVRWRSGTGYKQETIGTADDNIAEGTLPYDAAVKLARQTVETARRNAKAERDGPPPTVRSAIATYVDIRDARERAHRRLPPKGDANDKFRSNAEIRLTKHVLHDAIADILLHKLTEAQLSGWVSRLDSKLAASTRKRLINDLKAALNATVDKRRHSLPLDVSQIIRKGLELPDNGDGVEAEDEVDDNQILTDEEVRRLTAAARTVDDRDEWGGDLYRMVLVLAATGARFSQVARLRVRDVQQDEKGRRIRMPPSRKGRKAGEKKAQSVPIGQDVLDALAPAMAGRLPSEPLLERWRYIREVGKIGWRRDHRGPWTTAEMTKPFKAIAEEAELPGATAYYLRHSSIVRHIREGTPTRLVAALHDTSLVMIERTYSRYITDGLEELAARGVVPLAPPPPGGDDSKVVPLRPAGRRLANET